MSTNASTPAHLQLQRQIDGKFFVTLNGQTNQQYILQISTNLLNWSPAVGVSESVVTNSNPRFENVTADFGSNKGGTQFYRLGVSLSN